MSFQSRNNPQKQPKTLLSPLYPSTRSFVRVHYMFFEPLRCFFTWLRSSGAFFDFFKNSIFFKFLKRKRAKMRLLRVRNFFTVFYVENGIEWQSERSFFKKILKLSFFLAANHHKTWKNIENWDETVIRFHFSRRETWKSSGLSKVSFQLTFAPKTWKK